MQEFFIEAAKTTPRIFFDETKNVLEISGESYPENTAEFYFPFFQWLEARLAKLGDGPFTVDIELIYFNSSSSKILMNLFDRLDKKAEEGKNVAVNWIYAEENESSMEYGEEFKEDLRSLAFNLVLKKE